MGAAKKTKLWRLLGKSYAVPAFTKTVEPLRGLINQVSTWGYHVRHDEIPWTPFTKKLAESRLAIVTTAGLILEGQKPFDIDAKDGDPSFRTLPSTFDPRRLRESNPHWPHARFNQDHNVVMPIDRLRTLVERGVLGGLAPNFYSFGWGGGLTKEYLHPETGTAHQVAKLLVADGADFALFVPT